MNIIASFLKNFSPLPSPTSFHPQDGSESSANAPAGKEKGFESVLSGLAQNSADGQANGTSVTPQPRPAIRTAPRATAAMEARRKAKAATAIPIRMRTPIRSS